VAAVFSVLGLLLVGGLALALRGGQRPPVGGGDGRLGIEQQTCRSATASVSGARRVAVVGHARVSLPLSATARVVVRGPSGSRRVLSVTRRGSVAQDARATARAVVRETVSARGRACMAPGPSAALRARSRATQKARQEGSKRLPAILARAAASVAGRLRPTADTAARSRARAALVAPANAEDRRLLARATADALRRARQG